MKINRLLEIVIILLNKKSITCAELAERFEVSMRTIYRDVDILSGCGIPLYTSKGRGGGISIMDEYTMTRALLTEQDRNDIIFALQAMQATRYPQSAATLEKLGSLFQSKQMDWIEIDFSPWGSNENDRFLCVKEAILHSRVIVMDYINSSNITTTRKVLPIRLFYKHLSWYLWGYCFYRQDYRTFRMTRIKYVQLGEQMLQKDLPPVASDLPQLDSQALKPIVRCNLLFQKEALYRLYDDYNRDMIQDNGDETYTLIVDFPEEDWLYGYIMSYGPYVKVLEPPHLAKIIHDKCMQTIGQYRLE